MNRVSIKEFVENDKVVTSLLITQMNRGLTNTGAPYVSFTLQDKTGNIEAKLWDAREELLEDIEPGKVVLVNGEVLKYRNAFQFRIFTISKLDSAETNPSDYVASSHLTPEFMKSSILVTLASLKDPIIKGICQKIIVDYEDKVYSYPAAARNHHDFVGGLATHMIAMINLADSLCLLYPSLNRDLLIAGVLLHDLGKVNELSGPILTEYTLEGKLLGHISLMQAKVNEVAISMNYQDTEQVTLMRHLILSHHGSYEFGSPVLPLFQEAEILNYIDNIDARMNMLTKALEPVEEGQFTARIFPLENRSFYKPAYLKK